MANTQNFNAILNYASKYDKISQYLGTYDPKASKSGDGTIAAGDYAKIFFSGDGHIISHGIDYTPTFIGGNMRGLVPEAVASNGYSGSRLNFLGHDGKWKELSVSELPMAANFSAGSGPDADNVIYSAGQVYEFFNDRISAVDVMRFKGVFTPGVDADFTSCEKGDTYRISTPNGLTTYAGWKVQTGDLLICIKDSDKDTTAADIKNQDQQYWMVVECNIDGTSTHIVNGQQYTVYTDSVNNNFTIYAPVTGGTAGDVLISKGSAAPEWVDPKTYDLLSNTLKASLVGSISVQDNGNIEWFSYAGTSLGKYTPNKDVADWNISITGLSAGTKSALTLDSSFAFENNLDSFDGSAARKLMLMPASRSYIGGVIVDNRTINPIDNQAFKFAGQTISVDADGMIYLTKDNISNALGFVPGSTENVYAYSQVVTSTSSGTSADNATNPFLNLTSQKENTTGVNAVASTQFIGTNGIDIQGSANKIAFDLLEATTTTRGGIKVYKKHNSEVTAEVTPGADMPSRYYGVELDSAGKAFVYVPWEDKNPAFNKITVAGGTNGQGGTITAADRDSEFTLNAGKGINLVVSDPNTITINQDIWDVVKADKMGYAPAMVKTTTELSKQHYILSFVEGESTASWNKLPQYAFNDTWRAIQVGGAELANNLGTDATGAIAGSAINFTATGDHNKTTLTYVQSSSKDTAHIINIESSWRPIFVGQNELHKDYSLVINPSHDIIVSKTINATAKTESVSFELVWYNIDEDTAETTATLS